MKEVPVFIASSIVEFERERVELQAYLGQLNKLYKQRGVRLEWNSPEESSHAMRPDGSQSAYDDEIRNSEFCFFIVGRNLGDYTRHEFETAWEHYQKYQKPLIVCYFLPSFASDSVVQFRKRLKELKYFYKDCADWSTLKLEMQIELIRGGAFDVPGEAPPQGEKAAQFGQDSARKLIREQQDKAQALRKQGVTKETIPALVECYEEMTRLVKTYKVQPDALFDYLDFLWNQKLYDTAIDLGRWMENYYQLDDPGEAVWARLKNYMGMCYHESNRHQRAERYFREALALYRELAERNPDAFESDLALSCNNLGALLYSTNRTEEAERYFREALEICRKLAERNPDAFESYVALSCNNLGELLRLTNRTEEAERYFREALEIRRKLAERNPDAFESYVALSCNNLGILLKNTNRIEEAERYYREALKLYRKSAERNPDAFASDLAASCGNLGILLSDTNRTEEAERYYREALKIRRKLAERNPDAFESYLANICYNLGLFENQRDNQDAAKAYFKEALTLCEKYPHLENWARNAREWLKELEV